MAGKQIVKSLKLPLVGIIRSEHFQVHCASLISFPLKVSCVVQDEQPSHPARVYGNKDLVVFICEMSMKLPPEVIRSVVDCIFDFAHRHRSPVSPSLFSLLTL
jgi:predicted ATP-grasp superfamily ATP-dependent carboligase